MSLGQSSETIAG